MFPWKAAFVLILFLLPGGSIVLLAMATAKALKAGRDRLLNRSAVAMPVAQPVVKVPSGEGQG